MIMISCLVIVVVQKPLVYNFILLQDPDQFLSDDN